MPDERFDRVPSSGFFTNSMSTKSKWFSGRGSSKAEKIIAVIFLVYLGIYLLILNSTAASSRIVISPFIIGLIVLASLLYAFRIRDFLQDRNGAAAADRERSGARLLRLDGTRLHIFKCANPRRKRDLERTIDLASLVTLERVPDRTRSQGSGGDTVTLMFDINPFTENITLRFAPENAAWIMNAYNEIAGGVTICQRCRRNQAEILHECGGSYCHPCLNRFWAERRRDGNSDRVCPRCQKVIVTTEG